MKKHYLLTVAVTALLLTGCSLGPDYEKPEAQLPQGWVSPDDASVARTIDTFQEHWWQNFHDPILEQLIEKAVTENLDLKVAEARIFEARAAKSSAQATLLPSGDAMGSVTREANQFAIPGSFPGITKPFNIFETGFDASWELDLFGGHRREVEAANAQLEATETTRDEAVVCLMAEVARTYVDIRQYQKQLRLTEDIITSTNKILSIAQQRFEAGETPGVDVTEAKAQLEQSQAQIPYYRNMQAQAEYSLDVLIGAQPGTAHELVGKSAAIPTTKEQLLLGAPAAVIANRPDIKAAERSLAAATAEQGAALAQFFPDISLSGFIGLLNTHAADLVKTTSQSWLAGSKVIWPILSYGKLSANMDTADAQQKEAFAHYQKTVLEALSDVERSVTAYVEQQKYQKSVAQSAMHSRKALEVERERYKEGMTSMRDVLDAEIKLDNAENLLTQSEAKTTQYLVAAYKSLGGGWKKP